MTDCQWQRRAAVTLLAGILALASACSAMFMGDASPAGQPIGSAGASTGRSATDRRIEQIIRSRFAADSELGASRIGVVSSNGVVTLRGNVGDYAQRDRAVSLARDVEGVTRVAVQIGILR